MPSSSRSEVAWLVALLLIVLGLFVPANLLAFGEFTRQTLDPLIELLAAAPTAATQAAALSPTDQRFTRTPTSTPAESAAAPPTATLRSATATTTAPATETPAPTPMTAAAVEPLLSTPTPGPTLAAFTTSTATATETPAPIPTTAAAVEPLLSTPTPGPTLAASTTITATAEAGGLQLGQLFYAGSTAAEADEFIQVINVGPALDVGGWLLRDRDGNEFVFPAVVLAPGQSCRVYTNEIHQEQCGFSFGSSVPIWDDDGDVVELVDPAGTVVARRCWRNGCNFGP